MEFKYQKDGSNIIVNDVIYGEIIVPYPFSEIILSKEMLRLINISQTGFSQCEFEGLQYNNRLNHSIGAYHVMKLILDKLESILKQYGIAINYDDKEVALCSMLLHDIGHGPFSHTFERISKYSHEKRTTDILLGDTEISNSLIKLFGNKKLKKIASFIAETNDSDKVGKDSFTKLLNNLVSHQLDADRIDYLIRDAYYAGVPSSINLHGLIDNLNVIVNKNQEYELIVNQQGLAGIENVLIQRYQMYRDVYLCSKALLGDKVFQKLVEKYQKNESLHSLPLPESFKKFATNMSATNLTDFLTMNDEEFKEAVAILSQNAIDDEMVSYLSDFSNLSKYNLLANSNISIERIKQYLKEIFGDIDLENTLSIFKAEYKSKLYKTEQKLNVQLGNRICDITECTGLIRPQETLHNEFIFFNADILRMELGLSIEEFKKYGFEVSEMLETVYKKPEEFELKYIVTDEANNLDSGKVVIDELISHGFKIIGTSEVVNNDEYYDMEDLSLYNNGGSLRIREANKDNKIKYKGTYKMPLEMGEVYSSRDEYEVPLADISFTNFSTTMQEFSVPVDFSNVIVKPLLNSNTQRKNIILEKNGVKVCLSFDNTVYTNHFLQETMNADKMIEIEPIGKVNDRVILNEIHKIISGNIKGLEINKQSKYERGINSTYRHFIEQYYATANNKQTELRRPDICELVKVYAA